MEYYCINNKSGGEIVITDTLPNVIFWVDGTGEKVLYQIVNRDDEPIDITIPRQLPTGHQINTLANFCINGSFGKITISNGIKVDECAFAYSDVEEVVWPDDCIYIPYSCFYKSKISKISNIDNVVKIWSEAFSGSGIKKISWPTQCPHITNDCFYCSELEEIDNLSNVERIDREAFFLHKAKCSGSFEHKHKPLGRRFSSWIARKM